MPNVEVIVETATVAAATALAVLWLGRTYLTEKIKGQIKAEYDQQTETHKALLKANFDLALESHKAQLRSSSEAEMARLGAELRVEATKHEVRFSRLHEQRAKVIAKTYTHLKLAYGKLGEYVAVFEPVGVKPKAERREELGKLIEELDSYFHGRAIFLPRDTAVKITGVRQEFVRVANEFGFKVDRPNGSDTQAWMDLFERVQGPVTAALHELEDEFRRLLGDDSSSSLPATASPPPP